MALFVAPSMSATKSTCSPEALAFGMKHNFHLNSLFKILSFPGKLASDLTLKEIVCQTN